MPNRSRLYPELVADEIDLLITPLDECPLPVDPIADRPVLPQLLPVTDLGPGAERFSFERVARAVADHFWATGWDPALEGRLADPAAFAGRALEVLVGDVLTLMIRPLVQSLEPVPGRSAEDAYRDYCAALLADGLSDLAARYPVAWQRVRSALTARVAAVSEAVRRLTADHDLLSRVFGVAVAARIVAVGLSGDTHAGGRAVSVVEYDDGSRLVYKPRPVGSEAGYERLVGFLNRDFGTSFHAARVLDRRGYGYVEFVHADPSAPVDLRRVGELAALLYALNARDMHFTNILSTTDGPVPVDLETLLHPHRQQSTGTPETARSGYRRIEESVFGTGVLPLVVTREGRDGYVDVGYLGGGEVRGRGPFRTFRVVHPFRADMRVEWDDGERPVTMHRDQVGETAAGLVRSACEEMVAGFTEVYQLIGSRRAAFLRAVKVRFEGIELRYIHNATVQYGHCLRMLTGAAASADPDLARGLLKRIGIASRGADQRLVESECAQMWSGDVPFFLLRADGTTVTDGSADRRAVGEFERTPLELFRDKVSGFGPADLDRQIHLIRVAFNAKLPDPHHRIESDRVLDREPAAVGGAGEDETGLRALALRLGHGLADTMVEDRFAHLPHTWIGPVASAENNRPWPPGVLGYDLYTGRVGPALALAVLGRTLGDPALTAAAEAVFVPAARVLTDELYELRSIARAGTGAYNGFAGTVWSMATAAGVLDRPELAAAAHAGAEFLRGPSPQDGPGWFDTVSGGLGTLLVRQSLTGPEGDAALAEEAGAACGFAVRAGMPARMEYSGLAHGLAGLLLLAGRTAAQADDPRAARLADAVVDQLDTAFRADDGGVRTNRTGPANVSDSWCNGTAGLLVALSEAAAAGLVDPARVTALLDGLRDGEMATSLTLCHGLLGLHEVLGLVGGPAGPAAGDLRDRIAAHLTPQRIATSVDDPGIRYNHSPSLLVGQAGVAWHLATRLGAEGLPSPLALSRPAGVSS